MNDRELLELAAKAAGYIANPMQGYADGGLVVLDAAGIAWRFNPLVDDGDALRLAVNLRLDINFYNGFQEVAAEPSNGEEMNQSQEEFGSDILSATRRAIVRAAAEIGRKMI